MSREEKYREFCEWLASEAEDGYREFAKRGTPTERPFLGVRIPKLKMKAQEILRENYEEFLKNEPVSFEEICVRGYVIASLPYEEMLKYFWGFLDLIDNWATCDTFCAMMRKTVKKRREDFLEVIEKCLVSKNEFTVRVGLVSLLDHYMEFEYLFKIFDCIDEVASRDEYYIKMATAWLIAECFIKFPDETRLYLEKSELPKWTYNKAISKICDSRRVEEEMKMALKELRKK